jgi:transposase
MDLLDPVSSSPPMESSGQAPKADLTLSDRTYVYGRCGFVIDRDLNAARNLRNYAAMAAARGKTRNRPL